MLMKPDMAAATIAIGSTTLVKKRKIAVLDIMKKPFICIM